MHFEILVEDQSGKKVLDILVPNIIGDNNTFKVYAYKGLGHIPKNLKGTTDPSKRILLDKLPKLLRGYGKAFTGYPSDYRAAVVVVCDLDAECLKNFRGELLNILSKCNPKPETRFCIAIEEGESWFLGDLPAIKSAYPNAKDRILNSYQNDSICNTWEKLADALYPGGAQRLLKKGWQAIGTEKSKWAEKITPKMDVGNNNSASFCHFRRKLKELSDNESSPTNPQVRQ